MFQREKRYIVFKISDLPADVSAVLGSSESFVSVLRSIEGKAPLRALVIEADWPEYEPAWDAIQRRMEGRPSLEVELRDHIDHFRFHLEAVRRVASGEDQVANDDTGGMAYIADYINKHLDALAPIDYNENAELRARNDELLAERLQLNARIQVAYDALDQLARLGNGDRLGNSDGNVIAQEAITRLDKMAELAQTPEPLTCTCNEPDSLCQLHTF